MGEDYETKQFNEDSLLIWQKKSSACYLVLRQTWKESWFLLFDMEAVLGEGAAKQSFVFPYHLLALMKSQGTLYYQFDPTVAYETVYSKQDFLAFYRRLGQYRSAETTDGFQIMRAHGLSSKTSTRDCGTITFRIEG